jgi:gamma-glutamylcysteine synthetase
VGSGQGLEHGRPRNPARQRAPAGARRAAAGRRHLARYRPRVLDIARAGLAARGKLNAAGDNETGYLLPLDEIVASGKTPAERLLDLYNGAWSGDLSQIYAAKSF